VAVVAVVAGDWALRCWETNRLLTAYEAHHRDVAEADDLYGAQLPPLPWTETEASRAIADVEGAFATGIERSLLSTAHVRDVRILPWHTGLRRAQDRYLEHADVWNDRLTRFARDAESAAGVNDTGEINGTNAVARDTFFDAVPVWCWGKPEERAERVFT
jgi:hypothetical protein